MGFRSRRQATWGMLSPTFAILVLLGIVSFFVALWLGVFQWNAISPIGRVFTGLNNYRQLVVDQDFLSALGRGFIFVAITLLIQLPLGYGIAVLLQRTSIGRGIARTMLTLPLMIAPLAIGVIWILLTTPGIGPLPDWLEALGFNYNIGLSGGQAFATIVAMEVWQWTPFVTLVMLAGLVSLPQDPFDAARIDGASSVQVLRYITLPLLKPVILVVLFIRIMDAFRIFDQVWVLTAGGPGSATRFASIHLVRTILAMQEWGYGAAMTILLLFLTIIMCWLLLVLVRGREI